MADADTTMTLSVNSSNSSPSQPDGMQSSVIQRTEMPIAKASPNMTTAKVEKKAFNFRSPQAVVQIVIGRQDEQETFYVHKGLLCHHSALFATAFNNNNHVEAETQSMNLSNLSSDDFGAFVEWLYTQRIELDMFNRKANLLPLAKFWTLAQFFDVAKLQNDIMDKLRPLAEVAEKDVLKTFLDYVYDGVDDKPELRRLAADRMAWGTTQQGLWAWMRGGHLPDGMLVDIVMALKKDHVPGKATVRHLFGEAREYYVERDVKHEAEDSE